MKQHDYDSQINEQLAKLNINFYTHESKGTRFFMLNNLKTNLIKWNIHHLEEIMYFTYGLMNNYKTYQIQSFPIFKGIEYVNWDFIYKKYIECKKLDEMLSEMLKPYDENAKK